MLILAFIIILPFPSLSSTYTLFSDHTEQSCCKLIPQMCFVHSKVYSKRCTLSTSRSCDNLLCNFQILVHRLSKHIHYWKHTHYQYWHYSSSKNIHAILYLYCLVQAQVELNWCIKPEQKIRNGLNVDQSIFILQICILYVHIFVYLSIFIYINIKNPYKYSVIVHTIMCVSYMCVKWWETNSAGNRYRVNYY